jgi:hypothetical protein
VSDTVTHRAEDSSVTIRREIPLWGLLSLIGVFLAQALAVVIALRDQSSELKTAQQVQAAQMANMVQQITALSDQVGKGSLQWATTSIAQVKNEMAIEDLRRRTAEIEARRK